MKHTNIKRIVAIAIAAILGVYLYATPYIAASGLRDAVKSGDKHEISQAVNFPALRENLKNRLNAETATKVAEGLGDNPLSALGSLFATKFIDIMIEQIVTPDGIALMVRYGKLNKPENAADGEETSDADVSDAEKEIPKVISSTYKSLNRFAIVGGNDSKRITLVLTRSGLFDGWKLTDIDFQLPSTAEEDVEVVEKDLDAWGVTSDIDDFSGETSAYATSAESKATRPMKSPYRDTESWLGYGCNPKSEWAYVGFTNLNIVGGTKYGKSKKHRLKVKIDDEIDMMNFLKERDSDALHFMSNATVDSYINASVMLIQLDFYGNGMTNFKYSLTEASAAIEEARQLCGFTPRT